MKHPLASRLLPLVATTACAHFATRPPAPAHHYLERNYVFSTRGDTSLIYEGHPAAHLFLLDGLPLAYDQLMRTDANGKPRRTTSALRAIVSPMFRIRQLRDSSAAVRTPSFMPRIMAVDRLWVTGLGTPVVLGDIVSYNSLALKGLRFSLTHHSNGQAGCFRQGYRPVDARANECEPIPITDPSAVLPDDTMRVRLNGSDGDFSSTYLSAMGHVTWMKDFSRGDTPRYQLGGGVGFDWHPRGVFGELSDEQRPLYGGWRVRGQAEAMYVSGLTCADRVSRPLLQRLGCAVRGRTRVTLEGERAPKATGSLAPRIQPSIMPWRGSVEFSHAFHWLLGAGAFVRWHDGQDYYNIGFVNRRRATMIGVMLDVGGPTLLQRLDATNR
jgi:hypothetical protein